MRLEGPQALLELMKSHDSASGRYAAFALSNLAANRACLRAARLIDAQAEPRTSPQQSSAWTWCS